MTEPAPSIATVTLGCRLNGVETDRMAALATAAGHGSLAIVNTCAVTAEAVRQSRQAIRRLKREAPGRPVVVTGCAATIEPHAFAAMPEVHRVVPNGVKTDAASWATGDAVSSAPLLAPPMSHTRAFVAVQNGCDHHCTFCIIPAGRGASRSVAPALVVEQIRAHVAAGARDVVLTGVDLTAYGLDCGPDLRLGTLVRRILREVPELPRLRLSSLDCVEADAALLEALAEEPRLMPHLHLSLQSGSDLMLKRMRRRHGRGDAIRFCAALRAARPDVAIGADLIAGFPTETEAMFADTLSLIEACGLTQVHAFPFSPRPGTPAARMPAVEPLRVRERAARLRASGATALASHLDRQVGRRVTVLMERGGKGRAPDFCAVRPDGGPPPAAGTFAEVLVEAAEADHLRGRLLAA